MRNKRAYEKLNENSNKRREINTEYMNKKRADENLTEDLETLAKKREPNREYI